MGARVTKTQPSRLSHAPSPFQQLILQRIRRLRSLIRLFTSTRSYFACGAPNVRKVWMRHADSFGHMLRHPSWLLCVVALHLRPALTVELDFFCGCLPLHAPTEPPGVSAKPALQEVDTQTTRDWSEHTTTKLKYTQSSKQARPLMAGHPALKPECRRSPSTSCEGSTAPSAPPEPLSSKSDPASARAAPHPRREHHRIRHVCSTRLRMRRGSCLAFAMAKRRKKVNASEDHLPPPPPPRCHERYLRCFLRLAATKVTPSRSAAPRCGVPSPLRADTSVVSTASSAPPKRGRPSATTSSVRL